MATLNSSSGLNHLLLKWKAERMSDIASGALPISLEYFPPKTPEGAEKLAAVRQQLYALKPEYCSVTYGAGGSTQDGTIQTVRAILKEGFDGAPHFSCIGASKASVREQLAQFKADGIKRLVALRGDLPSGHGAFGEFRYASELVAFIREETGSHFHIEVGAYPEMHPQARNPEADMKAFVTKVKAGADVALTQYFFNSDAYFRFVEDADAQGVGIPIIPGIMPITNSTQLMRFSDACGAEIPRWIRTRLDVVTDLCEQLRCGGVPGLHFYTMNQAGPVKAICERLGL